MPSDESYLTFILDQLAPLEGITWRAMMGEYILYFRGTIIGGIYDDRLLVKDTRAIASLMPDTRRERPYEGAKEMLFVEQVDDRAFLQRLVLTEYEALTTSKRR